MSRRILPSLSLLFVVTLAACGGGEAEPEALQPVAPLQLPVLTTSPTALEVQEGSAAEFTVAGSSAAGELRYEWLLGGGGPIEGATTAVHRIAAASLLDDGKQFQARLLNDDGSTTSAAAGLAVIERAWGVPAAPMSALQGGAQMALATATDGVTHLLYTVPQANGSTTLHYAYKPPASPYPNTGGSWGDAPPHHSQQGLRLVRGAGGQMLALWRQGLADDAGGRIYAALLVPDAGGGSWIGLGAISTSEALDAADAAAALLDDQTYEVVYRQHNGTRWDIVSRRFVLNAERTYGSWGAEEAVEAVDADLYNPHIASDGQGNALVAFNTSGTLPRTYANTRPAGATVWPAAQAQEVSTLEDTAHSRVSRLAMNRHGRAVLLFRSDATRVYMRQFQFGGQAPGWQGGAAYVANRWEGLPGHVEPGLVMSDDEVPRFDIISAHNNGHFLSRWSCQALSCGGAQTFLNLSAPVADLAVSGDAAGNLLVATAALNGVESYLPMFIRYHAGLAAWRSVASVGQQPVLGPLHLAAAADGRAALAFATPQSDALAPRLVDFR